MNKEHLIYGKNNQKNIVSLEDNGDGTVDLFIQQDDGKVTIETVRHDYWILTDEPADQFSVELDGNGYYKYKNLFTLRDDYEYAKKQMRRYQDRAFFAYDIKESFMLDTGYTYYKGLKHSEVSVLAFDIETVGLKLNSDSKVLLISNTYRDKFGNIERKMFAYDEYKTTKEFLEAWCSWVQEKDPAIILGHNVYGFDMRYLDYVAGLNNCELMLGRKGKAIKFNKWESKFRKDGSQFIHYKKCHIFGREIIDTFFVSIRFDIGRKYESYGLKNIIKQEGLERLDRQFYDASLIRKNYTIPEEWIKIKEYCKDDSDDALALWDLMGAASFYMCQNIPKSLQDVCLSASGSQLNAMLIRSYLQKDHSIPKASSIQNIKGAISFAVPGIYKNLFKQDLRSMYPSIIIDKKLFSKEKDPDAHYLFICEFLTKERLRNKEIAKKTGDKYYIDLEQSMKIQINSLYGMTNTNGLNFNDSTIAEKITEEGRRILSQAIEWATSRTTESWIQEFVGKTQ